MNNIIKLENKESIEIINPSSGDRILIKSKRNKLNIEKIPKYDTTLLKDLKEVDFKNTGSKLRYIRKMNNYSVDEMAHKLGICKGYYSLIENGKRRLYYDLAVNIAKVFDLKPDDLFL